jgi:hypothetical protein
MEGEAVLIDFAWFRGRDDRRSCEGVAVVADDQFVVFDLCGVRALFLERVLDFEEVGEV